MYYADLTFYRDKCVDMYGEGIDVDGMFDIYPEVLNIGWLDNEHPFPKGKVAAELLQKLKELTFNDTKNADDDRAGSFNPNKAIVINAMHMRGSPYECPLCPNGEGDITLEPDGLSLYTGSRNVTLGLSEMHIPSKEHKHFYVFPTMLYHYISEHGYLPPAEFLDALEAFNMNVPFDINKAQGDLKYQPVSVDELREIDLKQSRHD